MSQELKQALEALLDRYTGLVNSGDAGNWNPETEAEVIAARTALARTQQPEQASGDWRKPTTYAERFTHVVALLCGQTPPDHMVADWIAGNPDGGLQGFAASNGPAWCQGIGLLDAAHVMADQPTEGVDHEMRAQQPEQAVPEGFVSVPKEPTSNMFIRGGEAFFDTLRSHRPGSTLSDQECAASVWTAMLAASGAKGE